MIQKAIIRVIVMKIIVVKSLIIETVDINWDNIYKKIAFMRQDIKDY